MTRRPHVVLAQALLIAAMAVGSVLMWIGVPVGWLVLASLLTDSSAPSLGPYLLVIVGIPVSMWIVGRGLRRLDLTYARLTGNVEQRATRAAWLKSMRAERGSTRRLTMLDRVMIVSVSIALVSFGVWFFAFAGSSLPGG